MERLSSLAKTRMFASERYSYFCHAVCMNVVAKEAKVNIAPVLFFRASSD